MNSTIYDYPNFCKSKKEDQTEKCNWFFRRFVHMHFIPAVEALPWELHASVSVQPCVFLCGFQPVETVIQHCFGNIRRGKQRNQN
jgi:hypothetical protein